MTVAPDAAAPGAARTVAILTALDVEYAAVRDLLSAWRTHVHPSGTRFELTKLPGSGLTVAIAITGVGNTRASVLTDRTITELQPSAVIFAGIAGALHRDLNLGDVVVATKVYAYGGGTETVDGFLSRPGAWEAPHELEQLAREVAGTDAWRRYLKPDARTGPRVVFRPIASGDVLANRDDGPLRQLLAQRFNDASAIEMESAGAMVAGLLNHSRPVLCVRSISDRADGNKLAHDRARSQQWASATAAAFAVELAGHIGRHGLPSEALARMVPESGPTGTPGRSRGQVKVEFCRRLDGSWSELADVLGIHGYETARFERGHEPRRIWEWLEARGRLGALVPALVSVDRRDLAELVRQAERGSG